MKKVLYKLRNNGGPGNGLISTYWIKKLTSTHKPFARQFDMVYEHNGTLPKWLVTVNITAQKMKFSIKDFFSKCDQIRRKLRSHLLKKSLMENFIFLCNALYYKCLGQDEDIGFNDTLNKEKVTKEYFQGVRKMWSSELYANNKVTHPIIFLLYQ